MLLHAPMKTLNFIRLYAYLPIGTIIHNLGISLGIQLDQWIDYRSINFSQEMQVRLIQRLCELILTAQANLSMLA